MRTLARLAAAFALVALPAPALAQPNPLANFEHIARYEVDVTVRPNGRLHVVETIDYVFPQPKHGILRRLPERVEHSRTHDRLYEIDNVRVTGSPGTPLDTELERDGGYRVIRVGDADKTITGRHRYVLTYDLRGAVNRFAGTTEFPGHDELYWNVIGPEWDVSVVDALVRVRAEASFSRSNCFAGPVGSSLACRSSVVDGRAATFRHQHLAPRQAMTVVLALPHGYAAEPGPVLRERWSAAKAFRAEAPQGVAAGVVLLAGLGGVGTLVRRGARDRQYAGQIPGLEPRAGMDVVEEPVPVFGDRAGPVEWSPGDVPPGLMGLLLDEEVHTLDVTATIVDLAVRGHLVIDELPRRGIFRRRNWRLSRVVPYPDDPLTEWEAKTISGVFAGQSTVELDDLKNKFHTHLKGIKDSLYDEAMARGWFTRRPDQVRGLWFGIAVGVTAVGGVATYVLARWTTFGLAGLALVAVGLSLFLFDQRMPFRTARGSAAYARALGFKRYLATAEAEQLRAEEKGGVFARYLPYAIVLGETERWAKVFKDLGLEPSRHIGWYGGPSGWTPNDFSDSMDAFSSSASSTVASTPGSSGASGFSGGSSGGGGGGGGGGSW